MANRVVKKDYSNLMEIAYGKLKKMIFLQHISPGQKLIYRELANFLHMSATPVQFALGRLEQEGFVKRIPHVGYYVQGISLQEINDLFDLRQVLEVHAVELAIEQQTPEDLDSLVCLMNKHKNYKVQMYDRRKLLLDAEFHWQIAEMSRNREIVKQLKRIFEHTYLRSPVECIPPERMRVSASQHEEILSMIRERNVGLAKKYLAEHIVQAKEARKKMLSVLPQDDFLAASI